MSIGRERYYLEYRNDDTRERRVIPLEGNEVVVGRKELRSTHISRNHAAFRWQGEHWTVTCIGQNNMVLDGKLLARNVAYSLSLKSEIRFTERDVNVYKLKVSSWRGMKESGSTSTESHKRLRQENESTEEGEVKHEYTGVEQQLRGSEAIQAQLKEERDRMHQSLQQQMISLEEKYKEDRAQLEEQFQNGALAQQAMLEEKEALAQKLHEEIAKLKTELEGERKVLEDRLKQEEERNKVLQEKENELRLLAEEKASLEEKQEAERLQLQQQLQDIESRQEELRQQVEDKNCAIQVKEAEYQLAEEERQRLQEALAQERLTREEEKFKIKEELMHTKAQEQRVLRETLDALEGEKQKLMADLASSAMVSSEAKKEVVESVSHVLEDEFQCAICNELFINAVLLNCSHTFCKYCIDRWKKNKNECPNCRLPIKSESKSLVVDNFIEKIVPTLSEEMKKKRMQMVAERNAEMKAAEEAAAAAAAAAASRGRGRGGRGRNNRGRGGQRGQAVMVHSTNMANTVPGAPSNYVNNQVQYIPHMGNQGVVRIRMPALTIRTLSNSQGIVRIQVPTSEAQNLQNIQVRLHLPAANGQAPPGTSSNPLRLT
ncbi:E3 ubiquitin-protein ligase RNF8-like isoform X2 [Portunus trituberculatus]|uniref:E3 ubiquitin-protein ligase RNF8-like isoform X2 n=1 Tax=Portunus trituberculatus TaxID=210409 RepID=UPI001E1CD4D5|nr:E3 ubiquitin-protein ligase RNF8-like isoform X2 [Portunus trituberculatus]